MRNVHKGELKRPPERSGAETVARNSTPNPDPEDMRKDLLAALAAGRELGPEMDSAIVDAHLRRHFGDAAEKPKAPAVVERRPLDLSPLVVPLTMVVGLAAYVAVLWFSGGHLWFLFWPLMAWGWWGWGGHRGRGMRRYERYQARRDARWGGDDGYLNDGANGSNPRIVARHEII
jgi:hypothetical protein